MHALLIADDSAWARSIESTLKEDRFTVHTADRSVAGIGSGNIPACDIIVLHLPDMSSANLARALRDAGLKTPIVIPSSNAGIDNAFRDLGLGAVDSLIKPFFQWEFAASVHAAIRRSQGHADNIIRIGDLAINLDRKRIDVANAHVSLTFKEYKIMELLALAKGAILSRETLRDHLYPGVDQPELKMMDIFIAMLRKKLANASRGEPYVQIVAESGFRLRNAS
jgi:two-component system, cell cycle response regulator CtrA